MLAPGQERNWCHFFARPPSEVFQDAHWARFAKTMGIDLRSLPYAFLALGRQRVARQPVEGATRILGRPRIRKGHALLDACDATGVRELRLLRRLDRDLFQRLERGHGEPRAVALEVRGSRIEAVRPID